MSFSTFRAPPGYPGKNPGISRQKFGLPESRWTYRTFWPPPHVEDPHPTLGHPDPKVWVCAPFSCPNSIFLHPFFDWLKELKSSCKSPEPEPRADELPEIPASFQLSHKCWPHRRKEPLFSLEEKCWTRGGKGFRPRRHQLLHSLRSFTLRT